MKFKNKNILIYGMANSGIAAANFLNTLGANVFLYDDNKFVLNSLKQSDLIGGQFDIIFEFDDELLKYIDLIVISPSVSIYTENLKQAVLAGVKVISELELGYLMAKGDLLAITGTNGKTTTVMLLENIFKVAKLKNGLVGNIGVPFTEFLNYQNNKPTYITEVSSFQLEAIDKFKPKIATILNLTPDHLDRHYTFENYVNQKAKIFKNMKKKDFVVLNKDDKNVSKLESGVNAQVYFYSIKEKLEKGVFITGANIVYSNGKFEQVVCSVNDILLKGNHNLSNILCAILICMLYKVKPKFIKAGIRGFKGVEHRLQFVKAVNSVSYYNDSKATNIDACLKAVDSFNKPIILLLGGSDKGEKYKTLFKNLNKQVKHILVYGDNASKIIKAGTLLNFKNIKQVDGLEQAVIKAKSLAKRNYIVLLAPAAASFDSFKDYKHRGQEFVRLVEEL